MGLSAAICRTRNEGLSNTVDYYFLSSGVCQDSIGPIPAP